MTDKNKKKTLTISSSFNKEIDTSSIKKDKKKSFSIEKRKPFKSFRDSNKNFQNKNDPKVRNEKKTFTRKFIEQQATKAFIKKKRRKII